MTTSAPSVSVIIPTYNRCDYIAETIESVRSQDHPAVEIIVVDDGSTDGTQRVLKPFEGHIRVITQPHGGQGAAVNRALELATGDYLTFVSDDDPILPGALSRLVDVLETDLHALAAYPDWFITGPDGDITERMTVLEYSLVDMLRHHLCYPGPCSLVRRSAVEQNGGWDSRWQWVADYDFWLRLGLLGSMVHVAEPLATWRRHAAGATHAAPRLAMAKEQIDVIESFFSRSDLPPDVRAVETEAITSAWAVAFVVARDGLETHGVPRFHMEDRLSRYVGPIPVAGTGGSAWERASREIADLKDLLELATRDKESLARQVEVLRRHLATHGIDDD